MPEADYSGMDHWRIEQEKRLGRLRSGAGDGTSGGMDGWQASVETRLGSINTDLRDLRSDIKDHRSATGTIATNLATLAERVTHLPSKGFIVTCSILFLAAVTALVTFQGQIQAFLKIHH